MKNSLLTPELKRPLDRSSLGNDAAAVNALTSFLNSPLMETAAPEARNGEMDAATALMQTTPTDEAQAAQVSANPNARHKPAAAIPTAASVAPVSGGGTSALPSFVPAPALNKVFFTGGLCVGKDYVAALAGLPVEGFARPLYALANHFFGGVGISATDPNKDIVPGMRAFLQTVGQWGRGTVNAQYPVTPTRAVFIAAVRSLGASGALPADLGVNWSTFGINENIWLDAALARIADAGTERISITNVRFANEFKRLSEAGFTNFHVITTPAERIERLAKRGLTPQSPVLKDISEHLAQALDKKVIEQLSGSRKGPKMRVIWNSSAPCPSARLWTLAEWTAANAAGPAAIIESDISAADFSLE
jgi:hypothetical protein